MTRQTETTRFQASSPVARACALGLAAFITSSVLASLGGLADERYQDALLAQLQSQPTQVWALQTLPAPERHAQA